MNREKLKQQIVKNFEDAEITEKERLTNVVQCIDAHIEQLSIHSVSKSLLDLDGKTIPVTFHVSKYKPKIDIDLGNDC